MNSISHETKDRLQRRKWLLIGAIIGIAAAVCVLLEFAGASTNRIDGFVFPAAVGALLFNVICLALRWLLTRNLQRIFLSGPLPFAIGLAKVTALITMILLILCLVVGLVAGSPYRETAFRALILAVVGSGVFFLIANGLLNAIVVVRHFRGTLATTSRVK